MCNDVATDRQFVRGGSGSKYDGFSVIIALLQAAIGLLLLLYGYRFFRLSVLLLVGVAASMGSYFASCYTSGLGLCWFASLLGFHPPPSISTLSIVFAAVMLCFAVPICARFHAPSCGACWRCAPFAVGFSLAYMVLGQVMFIVVSVAAGGGQPVAGRADWLGRLPTIAAWLLGAVLPLTVGIGGGVTACATPRSQRLAIIAVTALAGSYFICTALLWRLWLGTAFPSDFFALWWVVVLRASGTSYTDYDRIGWWWPAKIGVGMCFGETRLEASRFGRCQYAWYYYVFPVLVLVVSI